MVIIFNLLHLYLKKTMQQKAVKIKKIIRWTFRQWEPMCYHLGGVWGWQDCRRQVHHGLHLQGDADDEDIDDGDEKWEKLKDSCQKLYLWYIMIEQNICSKMHLTIMMMLINRLWWKWRLALWKKMCLSKISGGGERATHVKDVVKYSNPLLEAFGWFLLMRRGCWLGASWILFVRRAVDYCHLRRNKFILANKSNPIMMMVTVLIIQVTTSLQAMPRQFGTTIPPGACQKNLDILNKDRI